MRCLREQLVLHGLFWATLALAILVVFCVPQVTHIWQPTWPPNCLSELCSVRTWLEPGFVLSVLFVFVFVLGYFGLLSVFVVVPGWRNPFKGKHPRLDKAWDWIRCLVDRPLQWAVGRMRQEPKRQNSFLMGALCILGAVLLYLGAVESSLRLYLLGRSFCLVMGSLCLLLRLWLLWVCRTDGKGDIQESMGRVLVWLFATALLGELIWTLACAEQTGGYFSFRLYTTWCFWHLLTSYVIIADLIDYCHVHVRWAPVRLAAVLSFFLYMVLFSENARQAPGVSLSKLPPATDGIHATEDAEREESAASAERAKIRERWLMAFEKRIQTIPKGRGPVVIVAASGGGSRAAIFTSLALLTF